MQPHAERFPTQPLRGLLLTLAFALGAAGLGAVLTRGGIPAAGALVVGPPVLVFVGLVLRQPVVGVFTGFCVGTFLGGLGRVVPGNPPIGTTIDGLLALSLLGLIFQVKKTELARLNSPLVYLMVVWLLYTLLELLNPDQIVDAWTTTFRAFSLYSLELAVIALLAMNRLRHFDRFGTLWLTCASVLALWGFKQQYFGLSGFDQQWFDNWGYKTHFISGHIRIFSFCSDAGQYGAVMAYATLFCLIQVLEDPRRSRKIGYGVGVGVFFWAYALAGSRGPLFIIFSGFALYLLVKRNVIMFTLGALVAAMAFGVLKYTYVGQSNFQVQRMRSALDPEDPSLQLRLANQRAFAEYMKDRPFGSGIGMAGDRGKRYGVESELTKRGIDSWYVKIWVETGVVGLSIHVFTLLLMAAIGFWKIPRLKHPRIRAVMTGLLCGYVGILCGSYGNMIFGQAPTNFIMYLSMAFFVLCDEFDREALALDTAVKSPLLF